MIAASLLALLATAQPAVEVARLADGLEIVVQPMPGATWAALRVVVRAGGASDPAARAGLAHLIEHLAMKGSYDENGDALLDDARRQGARVNAHTTPDLTKFELDAPAAAFPALAERLVRAVTSPAWELMPIDRERGVLETEAEYHGSEGLLTLVDWALFPSPLQGGPLAGTTESRARLTMDDVERFYASAYVPANMTVVFAGAVSMEEARALVARSFRIPPAGPATQASPADTPNLPREQRLLGGVTVTLLGFALDPADRGACAAIAALAQLRLALALQVGGPMVPLVEVSCPRLRGNALILAAVYTNTLDAGDLPAVVTDMFVRLQASPPTAAERTAVDARLAAAHRHLQAEPELVAERLAALVADRGDPRPLAERLHPAPLPEARALARIAARSFVPQRRFLVHVTPTQM